MRSVLKQAYLKVTNLHTWKQHIVKGLTRRRWKRIKIPRSLLEEVDTYSISREPTTVGIQGNLIELVNEIHCKTEYYNRSNVSRTAAYLEFYLKHPEINWAFLAHMVSRNGGWNMTDLKGSIIPNYLTVKQNNYFFSFLEEANARIFNDAYPQLLLYEASKHKQRCLFHLLPYFNVSAWMMPVWEYFYEKQHSQFITVALIINEQNLIEERVIQNKTYQKYVLQTLPFQIQELLQFQKVIFPYYTKKGDLHLAGLIITDFQSVNERIRAGKKLYTILFGNNVVFKGTLQFAKNNQHTASRSDYWPHIFSSTRESLSSPNKTTNICKNNHPVIYSPRLDNAWPIVPHTFKQGSDWYQGQSVSKWLESTNTVENFDITDDYCDSLDALIEILKVQSKVHNKK